MYHVADFIIRIKNASLAHRKKVTMPYSNLSKAIAKVLVKEGYLGSIKEAAVEGKKVLVAELRYVRRHPVVSDVEVISKPSLRVYVPAKEISQRGSKASVSVFSTSAGVLSGKEALKKGVGGELLFKIW